MKLSKVMMSTHFTTVNGIFSAHALFNEGMPSFGLNRETTFRSNDVNRIPSQARVMNNFGSRMSIEHRCKPIDQQHNTLR